MPLPGPIEDLLRGLSIAEKETVLDWLARDLAGDFPGIDSQPEVCGGAGCIVRTRIPVWLLEQLRRQGASDALLLQAYPALRPQDLRIAWSYVRTHPAEIERRIRENEAEP